MPRPDHALVILLPETRRFAGQPLSDEFAKRLGRADRLAVVEPGERAQLLRYFELLPRGWPMAAITRAADCADAAQNAWLRADPAHVRADMGSVRLLACGDFQLTSIEVESFLKPLRPLFGDVGLPISAPVPSRWYLALPRDSKLPAFAPPTQALGEDVFAHLPEGPEGRRWRVLLNEAQILLHNHPRNAERIAAGLLPVNSLWFWGGGVLPDRVECSASCVISDDHELQSLCRLAAVSMVPVDKGDRIIDCRRERGWAKFEADQLASAFALLGKNHARLTLDFADGTRAVFEPRQRWRLFRRPAKKLA
jgi:hypothetical protein